MMDLHHQLDTAARALAVNLPAGATIAQRMDAILAIAIQTVTAATPDQFAAVYGLRAV